MRTLVQQYITNENGTSIRYVEIACDSSETKPTTGIGDGSIATETNTGKVYFFNEKTSTWIEQFSFQG